MSERSVNKSAGYRPGLRAGENGGMEGTAASNEVLEALKRRGYRMTPQRRAIVAEIMEESHDHIAPQRLVQRVKERLPGVNDSTVYRTLDLLEEVGFLSHSHLGEGSSYHHAGHGDHVHLICERCGRSEQLSAADIGPLERAMRRLTGFRADFTHFAISGVCEECARRAQHST
jgi:Fur family transcriptional regulator, ferric uptake regulator